MIIKFLRLGTPDKKKPWKKLQGFYYQDWLAIYYLTHFTFSDCTSLESGPIMIENSPGSQT